jgi:hypothetical protein
MSIFKPDAEIKRMIFNISASLADRLEAAKEESRGFGKRLDLDGTVNKALEKFLKKAEKKLEEMRRDLRESKKGGKRDLSGQDQPLAESGEANPREATDD